MNRSHGKTKRKEFVMKKIFVGTVLALMFAAGTLSANGKINKAHLGLTGKDGAKVNCVYCHTTQKVAKKKGQDKAALYKNAGCAGAKCHK